MYALLWRMCRTTFTIAPDAGFFQDYNASAAGQAYRADFQGADSVWNATMSGGLNHGWCCVRTRALSAFYAPLLA